MKKKRAHRSADDGWVVANLEIIITAARADKLDCEPHLRWG
jgi:hypothetical protein